MPRQSGFSLLMLIGLVVMLAAGLTFLLISPGTNVQGQTNSYKTTQLVAQAQLIVHRISKCAVDNSNSNNYTSIHIPYPLGASKPVAELTCPTPSAPNLWSGADGVYPPAPIDGFGAWFYTKAVAANAPTVIYIASTQPNAYTAAISAAAAKIGSAASAAADTLTVEVIK